MKGQRYLALFIHGVNETNLAALDGKPDTNDVNDTCPRNSALPSDKDCGAKKSDGTLAGDILTDVIVK